jgi:hypothetical protein
MTRWLVVVAVSLVSGFGAIAQPPAAEPGKSATDLRKPQEENAKLFRELSQGLLRLAQKLERSDRPEDQERAKTIRAALKVGRSGRR